MAFSYQSYVESRCDNYYHDLYCIVLHCIALHCIALHCIALHCIALYCIVLYCIVLYCIVLYCIVLYCIVLYCIVLYCIVLFSGAFLIPYITMVLLAGFPLIYLEFSFGQYGAQGVVSIWKACPLFQGETIAKRCCVKSVHDRSKTNQLLT